LFEVVVVLKLRAQLHENRLKENAHICMRRELQAEKRNCGGLRDWEFVCEGIHTESRGTHWEDGRGRRMKDAPRNYSR
jgi:hypothetical protein